MFKRQEASRIREEFWTTFGKYMNPIPSSEGVKVNWVNYHTRLKDVHFRMDAGQKSAAIYISIEHHDLVVQELYFQQFVELKRLLHDALGEEWEWRLHHSTADGKIISTISRSLPEVSIFNKEQWSELISFFKPRIIALDRFWEDAKYAFDSLR